jgi:hypothetical protein
LLSFAKDSEAALFLKGRLFCIDGGNAIMPGPRTPAGQAAALYPADVVLRAFDFLLRCTAPRPSKPKASSAMLAGSGTGPGGGASSTFSSVKLVPY